MFVIIVINNVECSLSVFGWVLRHCLCDKLCCISERLVVGIYAMISEIQYKAFSVMFFSAMLGF